MITDFDKAFAIVIGEEGGYESPEQAIANNDAGGETKFGICKRDHPELDIANLTIDQAKQIYRPQYWDTVKGDQLPYPLSVFMFDASVNQGSVTAIKMLQKAIGVAQDGILGSVSLNALTKNTDWFTARFMAMRAQRYIGTRGFDTNGDGWLTRLFSVYMEALK